MNFLLLTLLSVVIVIVFLTVVVPFSHNFYVALLWGGGVFWVNAYILPPMIIRTLSRRTQADNFLVALSVFITVEILTIWSGIALIAIPIGISVSAIITLAMWVGEIEIQWYEKLIVSMNKMIRRFIGRK